MAQVTGGSSFSSWALTTVWMALSLSLGVAGCGAVKKCKKGELGCINEPPKADGTCSANLELVDNLCVESDGSGPSSGDGGTGGRDGGTDGGRDGGADAGGDGGVPGDCDCAADEVCSPDGTTCLRYCDAPAEPLRTGFPPPPCRDTSTDPAGSLSFAQACRNTCLQECKRAEVYCPGFVCDPAECDGADYKALCAQACGDDESCMADVCEQVRDLACADFECPTGFALDCQGVSCTDTCVVGGEAQTGDGFCDDGDPLTASYSYCAFGSDCADCGPRRGTKPPPAPLSGLCVRDVGCEGFDPDFVRTASWCVQVPGTAIDQFACIPNCTGDEADPNACPEDFECVGLEFENGDPFVDFNGLQAFGCFPLVCE